LESFFAILNEVKNPVIQNQAKRSEESKDSSSLRMTSEPLNLGKLNAGTYKLQLYNIEGKDTIKTEQFFKVWDKKVVG
jgi:phosphatidate phosphatase PAH1